MFPAQHTLLDFQHLAKHLLRLCVAALGIDRIGKVVPRNKRAWMFPAQHAALAALTGPQECIDQMRSEYQARRDLLLRELPALPGVRFLTPEGAFYFFLGIKDTGMTGMEFSELMLKEALVVVVPGTAFGEKGTHHVRISYAASREHLMEACERMRRVLE